MKKMKMEKIQFIFHRERRETTFNQQNRPRKKKTQKNAAEQCKFYVESNKKQFEFRK